METSLQHTDTCPCGGGQRFGDCCGPLLAGAPAPSAEALMRSRYTAHVLADAGYLARSRCARSTPILKATGTSAAADGVAEDSSTELDAAIKWLDLRILRTERGGPDDDTGVVEFVARYKRNGRAGRLHEVSRFRRVGAGWCWLDGAPGSTPQNPPPRRRRR